MIFFQKILNKFMKTEMNNLKNTYYKKILRKNIEYISYLIHEIHRSFRKILITSNNW